MSIRKVLLAFHRYIGLLAALPLVLVALSGAVLVFEVELDRALHPTYWTVHPEGSPRTWQELLGNVRAAHRADPITMVRPPPAPDVAAELGLKSGLSVSIDPYTGRVLGARYPGKLLTTYIHQFHMRLLLGAWGERIVGASAIVLVLTCVTGLVLWWRRRTYRIVWNAPWRRVNFDAHYAIGIYSLLPWLVLGGTGAAIACEQIVRPALYKLTHSQPEKSPALRSVQVAHATPLTVDAALTAAATALPGARVSFMSLPQNRTGAFLCYMKFPEDHTPAGRSHVAIDQYSGRIIWLEDARTAPSGTQLWNRNRPIHTGDVFGWPSRLVVCAASLALVLQTISGTWMWGARKFSRGSGSRPDQKKLLTRSVVTGPENSD